METKPLTPLLRLRLERDMKRYVVAEKIGVNDRTLGLWEDGKRKPNSEAIVELAKVYGVDPNTICGWSEATAV